MKTHITRNIIMEEETTMMMTTMITLTDEPEREDLLTICLIWLKTLLYFVRDFSSTKFIPYVS